MTAEQTQYVAVTAREQAELLAEPRDVHPLGADEIAGRTLATVISAGTELAGAYTAETGFPCRTGYAAVLEVEAVGCEVDDLRPGDRVFAMGGHCSHSRFPRREVLPVPPGLAPEMAVLARLMGVSMSTVTSTTARPPARVLVMGLGLVGNLAAQIFAACGYEVIACEPSGARRELARRVGIADVFPALPLDDAAACGEVDLVVECSGHEQAALDGARCVRQRGEVVLVGAPWRRRTDLSAHELLDAVFHNYAVLRSGWEWEVPLHATAFRNSSIFAQFAAALKWLADGRIETGGLCEVRSPRQIQEAYQDLLHDRCQALSVVLDWAVLA